MSNIHECDFRINNLSKSLQFVLKFNYITHTIFNNSHPHTIIESFRRTKPSISTVQAHFQPASEYVGSVSIFPNGTHTRGHFAYTILECAMQPRICVLKKSAFTIDPSRSTRLDGLKRIAAAANKQFSRSSPTCTQDGCIIYKTGQVGVRLRPGKLRRVSEGSSFALMIFFATL